ncbi:MAG: 4'-phosphopantetheinyl transferase superfamily protein [Cyclobacteriaceae bacterium]|nr:4'-phosphopantetheinyl transferase superfamily protein [Cyclobacteriaceae bacterium]
MPLSKIESLGTGRVWGVWLVTETETDLSFLSFESCPEDLVHPQKRLEWLAGRALIRTLLEKIDLSYDGIRKDEFGKPFLKTHPHAISLSHSYPYVAAQIDKDQAVGIDVEQPKEKLRQVGPRVLTAAEVADAQDDLTKLCIYWCAKEAMYKLFGKRNLMFTDHLSVDPFTLAGTGKLQGCIQIKGDERQVSMSYRVTEEYVLVYTI